jgi:isoleucyl-tRNA synthetase
MSENQGGERPEYKKTVLLPTTAFPMKGNLPVKEPERVKAWLENDLYGRILKKNAGKPAFVMHDGPPYANGHIHLGHTLNKTLKDMVVRYRNMSGYLCDYVPGWDCHGLPIELQSDKELGSKKKDMSKAEIRRACRAYAKRFVDIQRDEFKRLGVTGRWDEPYLTMDSKYEGDIARLVGWFAQNGGLYKGKKPIHWCTNDRTALAEAEVEYEQHESPSIYVAFPFSDPKADALLGAGVSAVIWTTTPWTLPANLGISVNPEYAYDVVDTDQGKLLLAKEMVAKVAEKTGLQIKGVLKTVQGTELEGLQATHPFLDRKSVFMTGRHVTLEAGTGLVHTAPGHGADDYQIGLRYGLEVYAPVDAAGRYVDGQGFPEEIMGKHVFEANAPIIEILKNNGRLVYTEKMQHSYPHCWRCHKPIIFRATEQWFISMETNRLRDRAVEAIDKVRWIPKWGRERIYGMMSVRPDWCISRQRAWGVPIPVFYCENSACGEALVDQKIIEHVADQFDQQTSDVWYEKEANELLPAGTKCPKCGGAEFRKESDILDVWFDSGASWFAVLDRRENLSTPADLYLEGSDQHRGWFHSTLLVALGAKDKIPYKSVLTHGFVVDGQGRKMSKSLGNVIAPEKLVQKLGAEVVRLWVAAEDYRDDIRISDEILTRLGDAYRRIRNTFRYLLANLSDFKPAEHAVPFEKLEPIDRYMLHRLGELIQKCTKAYDEYEFHTVYHALHNFCAVDLSAFYLDVLKDRLYTAGADAPARRSSQTALAQILEAVLGIAAPILAFTTDEAWEYLPYREAKGMPDSVHLSEFPTADPAWKNEALAGEWDRLWEIRSEVTKALEAARRDKLIGSSLEAQVGLSAAGDDAKLLEKYAAELPAVFIVSQVQFPDASAAQATEIEGLKLRVAEAAGEKCERCWNYSEKVGSFAKHPTLCERCFPVVESLGL